MCVYELIRQWDRKHPVRSAQSLYCYFNGLFHRLPLKKYLGLPTYENESYVQKLMEINQLLIYGIWIGNSSINICRYICHGICGNSWDFMSQPWLTG